MYIVCYQKQLLYSFKVFPVPLQEILDRYFDGNTVTSQFHTINIIIIAHPPIYNIPKMGKKKNVTSDRVKKGAELCLKDPVFKVSEAMLASKHFIYKLKNRGKQMQIQICQYYTKNNVPHVFGNSGISPVSHLTTSTSSVLKEVAPSCIFKNRSCQNQIRPPTHSPTRILKRNYPK